MPFFVNRTVNSIIKVYTVFTGPMTNITFYAFSELHFRLEAPENTGEDDES